MRQLPKIEGATKIAGHESRAQRAGAAGDACFRRASRAAAEQGGSEHSAQTGCSSAPAPHRVSRCKFPSRIWLRGEARHLISAERIYRKGSRRHGGITVTKSRERSWQQATGGPCSSLHACAAKS